MLGELAVKYPAEFDKMVKENKQIALSRLLQIREFKKPFRSANWRRKAFFL